MHKSPVSSASMSVIPHNIKRQLIIFAINSCHSPKITQLLIMALVSSAERKTKLIFHCYSTNKNMCIHTSEYAQNILLTKVLSQTLEPQSKHPYLSRNQNTERLSCIQPEMKMFLGDKCESIFLCIKLILNVNQKTSFLHDE